VICIFRGTWTASDKNWLQPKIKLSSKLILSIADSTLVNYKFVTKEKIRVEKTSEFLFNINVKKKKPRSLKDVEQGLLPPSAKKICRQKVSKCLRELLQ